MKKETKAILEEIKKVIEDQAVCIRCKGQMCNVPVPKQPGVDDTINVHACTICGKMEFFMAVKPEIDKKNES